MAVPPDVVSLVDYERQFARLADPGVRAYVDGAAADGISLRRNRAAFDALCLLPAVLADMSGASAAVTLLGQELAYPIVIAPTAYHGLLHPEGERATALAARLTGTPLTVSTQASTTLEAIATVGARLWFQLYAQPRWADTLTLVRRAEAAGYGAIVLTVDAPVSGVRNMEQRAGFRLPDGISAVNLVGLQPGPAASARPGSPVFQGLLDGCATWETLARLCRATALPVLAKGILAPDDAARAITAGCAGIVVSNHGGRVLDTVPAGIEMLPAVAARVAGRVPVLVDGGIRRGTDIVKAIACGASAVMIGRPVLHALAVGGVEGLAHMLTVLQTELEAAMALTGRPRLSDIDAGVLWRSGAAGALAPAG